MQQHLKKIKKVGPLVKVKKSKVDEEAQVLVIIRNEKIGVVAAMRQNQKQYMDGVEQLNRIRTSKMRDNLQTLEGSLDYVKSQWYKLYQQVQDLEKKERAQIHQLLVAEQELKAVEKLEEKYQQEFKHERRRIDQKAMDEIALRKFNRPE
jgi:flagellar export protein FliJ